MDSEEENEFCNQINQSYINLSNISISKLSPSSSTPTISNTEKMMEKIATLQLELEAVKESNQSKSEYLLKAKKLLQQQKNEILDLKNR